MALLECDVLIVGGGVLGTWLLDLLRTRYRSPILLEVESLGRRQTGHSHAFLHQGYAYFDKNGLNGADVFIDSVRRWGALAQPPQPPATSMTAHHVFRDSQTYQDAITWRRRFPPTPPKHSLTGSHPDVQPAHSLITTDERCVPADRTLHQLRANHANHIVKVAAVKRIDLSTGSPPRVERVEVALDDGRTLDFAPNVLVTCAGEQTAAVLQTVQPPSGGSLPPEFGRLGSLVFQRQMEMIVARDGAGALPDFNGSVFGDSVFDAAGTQWAAQAFIVSRRDPGNNDLVWVFSGEVSDGTRRLMTGQTFRRLIIDAIGNLFSRFASAKTQLQWGLYEARLTTLSDKFDPTVTYNRIDPNRMSSLGVDNLLTVLPDRLTIVPRVADLVALKLPNLLQGAARLNLAMPWQQAPAAAPTHPEYWTATQRWLPPPAPQALPMTWAAFQQAFL